ncbi:CYTH and CHAD domain-containing protein [Shewanella baltica]|uniref:CYTH domain-containing protein n=1 Tax=Shewanella baltica TaxID=62322 RepID=UPI00217D7149|nr:CYTH and CHAD domain-containing protein [Shewanella baltica]MCS6234080.1 CYTH and CHAD domain-containing protein [Shewanella baltica]MCS6258638.1 CYTH and CHAD domain-containing protein [Shewanella baltica]MCS6268664.1 CYTH and CHAD domain-containing protein [Shewanella baltica]
MNAEIELKLFFLPIYQESLINKLDSLDNAVPQGKRRLANGYFDTPDLQLRQWDMGLRVRGYDAHREQTIKTAGQVVGGIHSRPEYNVTIQADSPDLSLFPASIWPADADLAATQAQLTCIFHTDFYRRAWHVQIDNSVVEVALDIGEITANGQQEALCELEFELLSGDTEALLKLAMQVASEVPVRLGKASKAQRGYRLAGKAKPLDLTALEFLPLAESRDSSTQDLTANCQILLETALERWQLLESMIAEESKPEACVALWWRMRACIRLLRMTLSQFGLLNVTLSSQFMSIEKQLDFIEQAQALTALLGSQRGLFAKLGQHAQVKARLMAQLSEIHLTERLHSLWQQTEYGQLQLAIVEILLKVSADEVDISNQPSLRQHADRAQQASWMAIVEVMPLNTVMTTANYLQVAAVLDESILVGHAYGSLYEAKSRDAFRAPWQDLVLGIKTLACYRAVHDASRELDIDLNEWLEDKQQSLLFAMESTRRNAMQQQAYW